MRKCGSIFSPHGWLEVIAHFRICCKCGRTERRENGWNSSYWAYVKFSVWKGDVKQRERARREHRAEYIEGTAEALEWLKDNVP